jgi:tetratricopeptide (TPR) repeat protein
VYLQARAYDDLGLPEVAVLFMQTAERLDPTYAPSTLTLLRRDGRMAEALDKADRLLRDQPDSPEAVYFACGTWLDAVRHKTPQQMQATLERLVGPLKKAFDAVLSDPRSERDVPGFGEAIGMMLGLCYDRLDRSNESVKVYNRLLARDPSLPQTLTMRGIALMDTSKKSAIADFQKAVSLGTQSVWPYVFLSREMLEAGNYFNAVKMCNHALGHVKAMPDSARALLLDGLAIGYAMLGQPESFYREYFDRAMDLDPNNEQIKKNYQTVVSERPSLPSRLASYSRVTSSRVIDAARNRLNEDATFHVSGALGAAKSHMAVVS